MGAVPKKQCEVQRTPSDWESKLAHPSWYGKILHMHSHPAWQTVILLICLLSYHAHYFDSQLFSRRGSGHEPSGGRSECRLPALLSRREEWEDTNQNPSLSTGKLHPHWLMQAHRYRLKKQMLSTVLISHGFYQKTSTLWISIKIFLALNSFSILSLGEIVGVAWKKAPEETILKL